MNIPKDRDCTRDKMLSRTAFHNGSRLASRSLRVGQSTRLATSLPSVQQRKQLDQLKHVSRIPPRQHTVLIELRISGHRLSTTANPVGTSVVQKQAQNQQQGSSWQRWSTNLKRLAFLIKVLRIPALAVSVYALGRQQGIIECSRNPRLIEDELLQTILMDVGVKDKSQVHIFTSQEKPFLGTTPRDRLQGKTVQIGNDIIRAASLLVRAEILKAVNKLKAQLPDDISTNDFLRACQRDQDFAYWTQALYRVEGEDPNIPWRYILIESPIPNAFVTELLAQRFFVTKKMFELYIDNEDELAVVLGHEMSHLILGHVSQRNSLETALRTVEVLLLSLDPTEGLVSLGIIAGLAWVRGVLMATFSRENETEADELGLRLAAMACYDTTKGAYVMKKMHDHQVQLTGEPRSSSSLLSMLDSHPPSLERYQKLLKLSETENPRKYKARCATIQQRLMDAVWGTY